MDRYVLMKASKLKTARKGKGQRESVRGRKEGTEQRTFPQVIVERRAGQQDAVADVEGLDRRVQQARLAALESLALVDDDGFPATDSAENTSIALKSFVGGEDDVRLERAVGVEELVLLDDLARVGVALQRSFCQRRLSNGKS